MRNKLLGIAILIAVSACSPQLRNHGYMPLDEDLAKLQRGVDNRQAVIETLGTPSTQGTIKNGNIYYVRAKTKQVGIMAPKEIDRQVLAVRFSSNGKLTDYEKFGLEQGRVVSLTRKITVTGDGELGFIRRLLSSIGGFDPTQFLNRNQQ